MGYLIIIVIFIVIVVLIISKKKPQKNEPKEMNNKKYGPQDFFSDYSYFLDPTRKVDIRQMLTEYRDETIDILVNCIKTRTNPKTAAFLLGQIGDKKALGPLFNAISIERAIGNKEAMEAAVVAIQQAPAEYGYTELERREIIDRVYHKRG